MRPNTNCPTCGAPIRTTETGPPLDTTPTTDGTVTVLRYSEKPDVKRHPTPDDVPSNEPLRYREHDCRPDNRTTPT